MSVKVDSRNIDEAVAILSGEGSEQEIEEFSPQPKHETPAVWHETPLAIAAGPTYYEQPVLKKPVWSWDIPAYYYLGGAAGMAFVLAAAAQFADGRRFHAFIRDCHRIGVIGSTAGGAFLIHDLGRPSRFLNMLRVFRPTSPMNMGAWILAGASPFGILATVFGSSNGRSVGLIGRATSYGAGVFGLGLAGYTGVLVGNSAVPVWQESRRALPVLFYASAMSSVASILELTCNDARAHRITKTFGTAGRLLELSAAYVMERNARVDPRVLEPLRSGTSGVLWKCATLFTAASLLASLVPRSKTSRRVSGILGTIGAICLRMAVHQAGAASARDPRATFEQQRLAGA